MKDSSHGKNKKDILLLCVCYRPETKATAVLAGETMEALAGHGFSVDVLCGYPKNNAETTNGQKLPFNENVAGVSVKRLRYAAFKSRNAFARLCNYFSFYVSCLLRAFTFRKYRAVVSYSNPPMVTDLLNIAAGIFKCRTVFIVHDAYPEIALKTGNCGEKGIMAGAMRRINKKLLKRLDKVVCISEEMRGFFINERGFPPEKVEMIPNWHRDLYGLFEEPAGETAGDGPFVCGYFGNMGVCQDMDTVVKGILDMRGNTDVRFVLAGDGVKFDYVKESLGNAANAEVLAFLTGGAYGETLSGCGCLAVSLCEGLAGYCAPSKFYSYLMAGKPVIVISDGKDMARDVEKYGCGFVVKNGDVRGFREAVEKLCGDRALAREMGRRARLCYLENYTGAESKAKYAGLFEEMLGKPPAA